MDINTLLELSNLPITWGRELTEALRIKPKEALLVTHVSELDTLQDGGLHRGSFLELSGSPSTGRFAIALATIAAATQAGEAAALIDLGSHLDPQDARAHGIDLKRLFWVRPKGLEQALLCTETILQTGFPLVILDLSFEMRAVNRLPQAVWVRLARAAHEQKSILLVSTAGALHTLAADGTLELHEAHPTWQNEVKSFPLLDGLSVELTFKQRKGTHIERTSRLRLSGTWL